MECDSICDFSAPTEKNTKLFKIKTEKQKFSNVNMWYKSIIHYIHGLIGLDINTMKQI